MVKTATARRVVSLGVAFVLVVAVGAGTTSARPGKPPRPNAVLDWSAIAEATISVGRPPASSFVLSAMVHVAMYDAVVAIRGGTEPYAVSPAVRRPTSVDAAVATAAYGVLLARAPAQAATIGAQYAAYLDRLPKGSWIVNGIILGAEVASGIVGLRSGDGFNNVVPFVQPPVGPGVFEPVAPTEPIDVKLVQVTPFAMTTPDAFRPDGPDALTSAEYAADLAEVAELGRADSAVRTGEQTEIARFWAENTFVQWSRTFRSIATDQRLDVAETARMLAMVHVSAADGAIGCFEAKYHYNLWRPSHAIQRADTDGNPDTTQDLTWTPLLTVNHPEYPSGHACVTGAITPALGAFFGTDDIPFVMSSTVTGTSRTYPGFSYSLAEVVEARIWSGLHFRNSMEEGAELGQNVADLVSTTLFQPAGS